MEGAFVVLVQKHATAILLAPGATAAAYIGQTSLLNWYYEA
jgi:hypothetical protein